MKPGEHLQTLWMAGMHCLRCIDGRYEGYQPGKNLTTPCELCGDVQPAKMRRWEFHEALKKRDANPKWRRELTEWVERTVERLTAEGKLEEHFHAAKPKGKKP